MDSLKFTNFKDDLYEYDFQNLKFINPIYIGTKHSHSMTVNDRGELSDIFGNRIRMFLYDQKKLDQAYSDFLIEKILLGE